MQKIYFFWKVSPSLEGPGRAQLGAFVKLILKKKNHFSGEQKKGLDCSKGCVFLGEVWMGPNLSILVKFAHIGSSLEFIFGQDFEMILHCFVSSSKKHIKQISKHNFHLRTTKFDLNNLKQIFLIIHLWKPPIKPLVEPT